MNITLHQLQLFLKVAESGSITKTAEALHLTQPAVSIQLRNFQRQFDIALMETVHKKIYLTDFGRQVAETAGTILLSLEQVQQQLLAQRGELSGRLRLSVVSTGKYVIPYFINTFLEQHKGVELVMNVTNKQQVVESLENNQVDFSLVSLLPEHLRLKKIELMPNKLVWVAGRHYRLPMMGDVRKLGSLPLIFREKGSATRMLMERFVNKHTIRVQRMIELSSNEAVKQAVLAGLGLSLMPLIGLRNELQLKQIRIISLKGTPLKTHWNLVWLKEKKLTPLSEALITHITEHREEIIREQFGWTENY
jgi:DNA-binding transcriptional LysR family regulator